jgi:hypothetical protein
VPVATDVFDPRELMSVIFEFAAHSDESTAVSYDVWIDNVSLN